MTLPLLGGTPAVWNTAMVFFQSVLLLGYAYAHFSIKYLNVRKQALLHIVLLLLAVLWLPIALGDSIKDKLNLYPAVWLLLVYAGSIGVVFFVLSTLSPLLQAWFAHTDHPSRLNPYFLYSASNIGSLAALLSYPFLIEPAIGLELQSKIWATLYVVLIFLIVFCVFLMRARFSPIEKIEDVTRAIPINLKLKWIFLAFIPSSLLLSVTTHISTDLASAPFLWILPLSLFLLTFVIVFSNSPLLRHHWMLRVQAYSLIVFSVLLYVVFDNIWLGLCLHLSLFFINSMVCHGELVENKPTASELTIFYFCMSIGGALGGIFTALLAPVIFDSVIEYPLGILLACLIRPGGKKLNFMSWSRNKLKLGAAVVSGASLVLAFYFLTLNGISNGITLILVAVIVFICMCFAHAFLRQPIVFGICIALLIYAGHTVSNGKSTLLESHRSFYAVHKITEDKEKNRVFLKHGTTVHGVQRLDDPMRNVPLSYYHRSGPAGQVFVKLNDLNRIQTVGVVGLGLGALTCYGRAYQQWWLYEIDSLGVQIASEHPKIHYMRECANGMNVILGDGRISLSENKQSYDLLVIDAFSSDSIPVHLLTLEAISQYIASLSDRGLLLMHVSNRHLDVSPVIAEIAKELGVEARIQQFYGNSNNLDEIPASDWIILGSASNLNDIVQDEAWQSIKLNSKVGLWTDDFSSLLQIIKY